MKVQKPFHPRVLCPVGQHLHGGKVADTCAVVAVCFVVGGVPQPQPGPICTVALQNFQSIQLLAAVPEDPATALHLQER